jgi:hypothetical protein
MQMKKKANKVKNTFEVRFTTLKKTWAEKVNRPVTDKEIANCVVQCNIYEGKIRAESTADYGGVIFCDNERIGSYFIAP